MNRQTSADALDRELESVARGRGAKADPDWQPFVEIAADLGQLANPEFKSRLKSDLLDAIESGEPETAILDEITCPTQIAEVLPALGGNPHIFPADQRSFLISFLSHAALIALIASGIWGGRAAIVEETAPKSFLTYLPAGDGGGGSGDRRPVPAGKPAPPELKEPQPAPPAIVVRRQAPPAPAPAAAGGPLEIKFPPSEALEAVLGNVVAPSNGTRTAAVGLNGRNFTQLIKLDPGPGYKTGQLGYRGGPIGAGGGIGSGPGRGPGGRGSRGILAPRVIYDPDPEYSEEARKAKLEGTVLLFVVVDERGRPRDIRVARSLGMGLDEKAVEALKRWKFAPGTRDGIAVSTEVSVELSFRLY